MDPRDLRKKLGIEGEGVHRVHPKSGDVQESSTFGWDSGKRRLDRESGSIDDTSGFFSSPTNTYINPESGEVEEQGYFFRDSTNLRVNPETGVFETRSLLGWSETNERIDPETGIHQVRSFWGWDNSDGNDRRNLDPAEKPPPCRSSSPAPSSSSSSSNSESDSNWLVTLFLWTVGIVVALVTVIHSIPLWLGGTCFGIISAVIGTEIVVRSGARVDPEEQRTRLRSWQSYSSWAAAVGAGLWCSVLASFVWNKAPWYIAAVIVVASLVAVVWAFFSGSRITAARIALLPGTGGETGRKTNYFWLRCVTAMVGLGWCGILTASGVKDLNRPPITARPKLHEAGPENSTSQSEIRNAETGTSAQVSNSAPFPPGSSAPVTPDYDAASRPSDAPNNSGSLGMDAARLRDAPLPKDVPLSMAIPSPTSEPLFRDAPLPKDAQLPSNNALFKDAPLPKDVPIPGTVKKRDPKSTSDPAKRPGRRENTERSKSDLRERTKQFDDL